MSDKLATVLDRISAEITDSLSRDVAYKKQRDDQLFGMMFQNELQNQNLYKQKLIEAGLSLDIVDQSDGFDIFAGNAGDSAKLNNIVSSYANIANFNQSAIDSLTQLEAGKDAGGILRSAGLATTPGESGASTMMFNPDELKAALSYGIETGTISPEQAVDNAFLKGLQLNEEEALKMINLQTETKKNEVLLDNAAIEGSKLKLESLEALHGDTSATAGSIVIDRLQGAGIDVTFFQRIAEGDKETVETKSEMLSELQNNIIKEHPELASDLISALKIYASPDEQGHNKHYGLVQLGLLSSEVMSDMAGIENWAYQQPELRSKLGLKIDSQHGGLDEDSIDRLRRHLDGESQIQIGDNIYAGSVYGDLIAKNNSLAELNLVFDESALIEFDNIIHQNDRLDVLRINQFNELFGEQGYDASYTDIHPASSQSYFNSQHEIVDGYLNEIENMELNVDTSDDDMDPFGLNIDIDLKGLNEIVDAETAVDNAGSEYSKAFTKLNGIPGLSTIINQMGNMQRTGFNPSYVPSIEEVNLIKNYLVRRIEQLADPQQVVGPFGLMGERGASGVLANVDDINYYIEALRTFGDKYEALSGKKLDLQEVLNRNWGTTSELDKSLDLLQQNQEVDEDYDEDYPPVVRFMQGGI